MEQQPSLAELVDRLFQTYRAPDGGEFSYMQVTHTLKAQFGVEMDSSHISRIRKGDVKNPGRSVLLNLCLFFKVPASYFFPELERFDGVSTDPQHALRYALRSYGLSTQMQQHVEQLLNTLRSDVGQRQAPTDEMSNDSAPS